MQITYSAVQNRNVSGGWDIIQYAIIGTFADGTRRSYSVDDWTGTTFEWDWIRGTQSRTHNFSGIGWGSNVTFPDKLEIEFYNGTQQYGAPGPLLDSFDLSEFCVDNSAPVADAGEDITGALPNKLVFLDGTGSSDGDGDVLSYSWRQVGGPVVELAESHTAEPSFFYPPGRADQILEFELTVYDGTDNSDPDTVTVVHNGRSNGKNTRAD